MPEPPKNQSVERWYAGAGLPRIAAQLGISGAAVSALQIRALGKLRKGMLLSKFSFTKEDLLDGRQSLGFFTALTHALAERAFADKHGLTLAEVHQFVRAIGLDPKDPKTWLPTTSQKSHDTTPPSP